MYSRCGSLEHAFSVGVEPLEPLLMKYKVGVVDPASISSKDKYMNGANGKVHVVVKKELHKPTSSDRSCIHLEFNISDIGIT
ncbi:hypothetical protein Tco_1307186 [Tanacetum coccineum]